MNSSETPNPSAELLPSAKFPRWQFSDRQLEKISDIVSDLGIVIFASIALPAVLDKIKLFTAIRGGLFAILLWLISLWIRKYLS